MSADNCVAISRWVEDPIKGEYSYRVAHCQAIENCDEQCQHSDEHRVLYFGDCKVLKTQEYALREAVFIYEDLCVVEYGIRFLYFDVPFPKITKKQANDTLEHYWRGATT
jgi:hypothetical protein